MILVTATIGTTAQTLEQIIQGVVLQGGPLPASGRVAEIHLQWRVGGPGPDFHIVYKEGIVGSTINLATDSGRVFNVTDNYLEMRSPVGNQISLREIYLVAASGTSQVRIIAWFI